MKKLLDMLFEPEENEKTEVIVEAPLEEVRLIRETKKQEAKPPLPEKKKEVKKVSQSFINLEELQQRKPKATPKVEKEVPKQTYEFRRPLSPVFGYLGNDDGKELVLHTPQLNEDTSSALGTIISPYYGPRTSKKEDERKNVSIPESENKKDVLPVYDEPVSEKKITLKSAEELPISPIMSDCSTYSPHSKETIGLADLLEASSDKSIADTEISLFDELFRSEGE